MAAEVNTLDVKLKEAEQTVATITEKVNTLQIKNDEDQKQAADILITFKKEADKIEETRDFFVRPLNDQVKAINAKFKPRKEEVDKCISTLKKKLADYYDKKEAEKKAEQKRLDAIRDAANANREEKGQEAITAPVRQVEAPATVARTEAGAANMTKVWTFEIEHIDQLPEDVKRAIFAEAYSKGIIDTIVRKLVAAGMREIPGVRIYQETRVRALKN